MSDQKYEAVLVSLNVMTRVVVPTDMKFEDICEVAKQRLIDNVEISCTELVEDIFEDTEMPFNPETDKDWVKKYE